MRSHSLQELVKRLKKFILPVLLALENLLRLVVVLCGMVDARDNGPQTRVVVHVAESAGELDEREDRSGTSLRLVVTYNQGANPETCLSRVL